MEDFRAGDRVKTTQVALDAGVFIKERIGTVTSVRPRKIELIHVVLDGNKTGTTYHKKFWTKMSEDPTKQNTKGEK